MGKEFGYVSQVMGPVIDVHFVGEMPALHSTLTISEGSVLLVAEVTGVISDGSVRCLSASSTGFLRRGSPVVGIGKPLDVPVGRQTFGRRLDFLGEPLDGNALSSAPRASLFEYRGGVPLENKGSIIETGIKVIDLFCPLVRGGKVGILGAHGTGKTILMTEITGNVNCAAVLANLNEHSCDIDMYNTLRASGRLQNAAYVCAPSHGEITEKLCAALSALTMAQYLSDNEKGDVLFLLDGTSEGISRTMFERLISSFGSDLPGAFNLRGVSSLNGSVTSVRSASRDLGFDLSSCNTSVVMSGRLASEGIFPAVDPLASLSDLSDRSAQHALASCEALRLLSAYDTLRRKNDLSDEEKILLSRGEKIKFFLSQPLFSAQSITSLTGAYVPLKETISSILSIASGEYDALASDAFLYIGSASDALE